MAYSQLTERGSISAGLEGLQRVLLKLEGATSVQGQEQGGGGGGGGSPVSAEPAACACRLQVDRPVYQQAALQDAFCSPPIPQSVPGAYDQLRAPCVSCSLQKSLLGLVPAISWLSAYQWKHDFIKDLISGCTVAVMNIPQGMAYALLGNVPPVVGIYMAIFPVIVYALLGTSRHVAMGSFAVICLMTGKVVAQLSTPAGGPGFNSSIADAGGTAQALTAQPVYSPMEVATAVCFMVAIYQLIMFTFRMGIMCSLLSDTLVNGFTAGAAIHVFTSQIKDLFGMEIPKYNGNFQIVYTFLGIFQNLTAINIAATVISCITVIILVLDGKYIKPWVSRRSVLPVPIELIAVTLGTAASWLFDIHHKFGLTTVGHISVGLPDFQAPNFELLPKVAVDSFIIAVIAYIVTISMALIFAQKFNYEIDANQELLAQGAGNLVGSFTSCMPMAASLSRSVIQQSVGGRTQLASIICAAILAVVLISFGPVFEPLPRCILASLIIVALKGVLLQVKDVVRIWRTSSLDGIVWLATYVTVVLVEIDIGLLVGLTLSIMTILLRGIKPQIYRVSRLPNTDIYVESSQYGKVEDITGICIVRYTGGLNFANRSSFKEDMYKIINKRPREEMQIQHKPLANVKNNKVLPMETQNKVMVVVLDLSGLQYVDPSGAGTLQSLASELYDSTVSLYLAATSGSVASVLHRCGVLENPNILSFPTVHDAVLFAQSRLPSAASNSIRL